MEKGKVTMSLTFSVVLFPKLIEKLSSTSRIAIVRLSRVQISVFLGLEIYFAPAFYQQSTRELCVMYKQGTVYLGSL